MGNWLLIVATQIMVMCLILGSVVLFLGLGVLILLQICVVGRALRGGRNALSRRERCSSEATRGLSSDELDKLPRYVFDNQGKESYVTDCAVCLESFEKGELCRLLPACGHSFHVQCVDFWLLMTPLCPICRARACEQKGGDKKRIEGGGGGGRFESRARGAVVIGFPQSS